MGFIQEIKSALSIAKNLQDPKLMEHLVNLQTAYIEARERTQELEKENEALKKKETIQESLTTEQGVYFTEVGGKKDGPFCTRCWDVDGNLVRLWIAGTALASCPQCKTGFGYLLAQYAQL